MCTLLHKLAILLMSTKNETLPTTMNTSNILDIIHEIKVLEALRDIHFETKSKLWKAIYDHISTEKNCVLINREAAILCDVTSKSDSSEYAFAGIDDDDDDDEIDEEDAEYTYYINYAGAYPHYVKPKDGINLDGDVEETIDSDMFVLNLTVTYIADNEEYTEFTFPYTKEYSLLIPTDLEVNFTKAKFKSWIQSIKIAIADHVKYQEMQQLSHLVSKYKNELQR